MTGVIVDKLRHFTLEDGRRLSDYLMPLAAEKKLNQVDYEEITESGIWRICVDFKEVEDASAFLMRFWGMKLGQKISN